MPRQHHYSNGSHLHFITASTYRRVRLFDSPRFRKRFIETIDGVRTEFGFRLVGYVLMPEHFHLLISPGKAHSPSRIVGSLKQRTARHIIENLKCYKEPWCRRMLEKIVLPETVHDQSTYRVWQRRFYDFNAWSESKRLEKLEYMHGDPVKRRLVENPVDWPWSSWRFYHLGDTSVVAMQPIHVNRPTEWRSLVEITILPGAAFSLGRQWPVEPDCAWRRRRFFLFSDKLNSSLW